MSIQYVPSVWNTIARHFLFSLSFKACLRVVARYQSLLCGISMSIKYISLEFQRLNTIVVVITCGTFSHLSKTINNSCDRFLVY